MRRRKAIKFLKQKSFIIVLMVCFVSAVALTGLYKYGNQTQDENLVDLNEMDTSTEDENQKEQASTENVTANNYEDNVVNSGIDNDLDASEGTASLTQNGVASSTTDPNAVLGQTLPAQDTTAAVQPATETVPVTQETAEAVTQEKAVETDAKAVTYNLKESDKLIWPVEGNVLLNYNMDNTIYFATLNQYKCNPAIVIQSEPGTPVKAAANGKIESIDKTAETGSTIVMDLGNGYKATYGQLKNIKFEVGDVVAKGQTLASVSDTTKYYSVEGNNLYFKLTKEDKPVNPMNFLE